MKLTKKQEREIMQVYEAYWAEYLNGNVNGMVPLLDASYTQVGSAESEVFSTKKEAVQFLVDTIDQVAGKLEMRNRSTNLEQQNGLVLIHELCDLYALADKKWAIYSKFRATTLLTEKKEGWKIIHQHSSFPDSKTEEGQNVAIDKIAEENRELREAVKRRTVELEQKNRELEIETALEKVRSRSMAMHKSEELADLSLELVKQVQALGVATWFCAFNIYDDDQSGSLEWGSNGQGTFPKYRTPREGIFLRYYKAGQRGESLLINEIGEKECPGHYEYLCTLPGVGEQLLKMKDSGIPFPKSQIDHVAFFKYGYVLFITFEPAPEAYDIFKRFAKVFEQTYTRFLDLQKAEAQSRESQIEAALERVRSKTMAMHNSNDVGDTVVTLFDEVLKLGLDKSIRIGIGILEGYEGMETWSVTSRPNGKVELKTGMLDMTIHPMLTGLKKAWKSGKTSYKYDYIGGDVYRYYKALNNEPEYPFEADLDSLPENEYHKSFFYDEGILFSFAPNPISEESAMVLNRFAGVFGQTYRRYLDLQKAEAQVREAQIETALERVRSRSMAMHSSSEIGDVAHVLFQQLNDLEGSLWGTGFAFCQKDSNVDEFWFATENGILPHLKVPNTIDPAHKKMYQGWKKKLESFSIAKGDKELVKHYEYMLTVPDIQPIFQGMLNDGIKFPTWQKWHATYFKYGYLLVITTEPYENEDVFKRFAKVFEQAYTRFLDLQKAEAQARESQIEAALEKVRSSSLAMHKSDEMQLVVDTIYEQLKGLGFEMHAVGMSGAMDAKKGYEVWAGGVGLKEPLIIPYSKKTKVQRDYNKVLIERTELFAKTYKGKIKKEYIDFLLTNNKFPTFLEKLMIESTAFSTTLATSKNSGMQILRYTDEPYTNHENTILTRFAKVFEQAYIRFMDLQKAEAQARESQIEAALEKVRSRSLAMQKPEELQEVVTVVAEELKKLDVVLDVGGAVLCTYFPNSKDVIHWTASDDPKHPSVPFFLPYFEDTLFDEAWASKLRGDTYFAKNFSFEVKNAWFEKAFAISDYRQLPEDYKNMLLNSESHAIAWVWAENSAIMVPSLEGNLPSEDEKEILIRFSRVFEQAYIRFMDLQKAAAQAREAQIENALEKVRSRTMAMQKGEEVKDVVVLLYKELIKLGLTNFVTCGYVEINETTNRQETWVTNPGGDSLGLFYLPLTGDATFDERYAAWKKQQVVFHQKVAGKVRSKHLEYAITTFNSKEAEEMVLGQFPDPCVFYCFNFSHGYLHIVTGSKLKEEEESLLARFTRVFEQTYARFLDLKKAEAQTREAQIENALEKVRSRTMAMQKSEELPEAANNLFLQVQELGIPAWSAGYCIWETEDKKAASCNMSSEGEIQKSFILPTIGEGYNFYDPLKKGEAFYIEELGGDALVKHYEFMQTLPKVGKILEELINAGLSLPTFQIFHILYFPHGYLMFITYEQVPEAHDIFKRFAKVFEQTYTRFLDLKKAEAQAREATKQASLDRIRGQIASMRATADLNRITPLLWNELTTLGLPFIRCGVFIIDEPTEIVEVYLSAPDGHSLGVLNLKFNADPLTKNTVVHWRKGKIFKAHWNREEFISWTQSLMDQGLISDKNTYQGAANPPKSLDLHFIPFTQGMLYVGSENPLNDRHIELVQSLADAFAIAYARYEDFTKLEKAKKSVEATLSELKATQNQLVQSEKMASLGELTAGIAHEIQNPLNFVNNFSEVSGELIEEMNEEIEKGDMEEAKAIANDVKQNLEKILHHGKRADAIVKGMLQHSRSSTGVKEPTDINALADEYLRLAYHGLRAKDKSFNATVKTDYDDSLEKVNVIPQDIGRVILNLITNAFYVVDEKKKRLKDGYEPTVSVRTIKGAGKIEISVKDNGNGIPDKVKEKIFQPFFTTKPTGKGTGLGLSMSYDIVNKGHGGELRVETTEGEGTTFTIALPMV